MAYFKTACLPHPPLFIKNIIIINVRSDLGIASPGRFAWAWGGLFLRHFLCSSTHRKERTFLVISLFTAMDDTSASAFSTAMDDTSASAFSTAMDDTSASVFMTWTTSARFTDAPVPKVIALTAARYQPHPSFRTALLSSEHARSSPQGSTTAHGVRQSRRKRTRQHPATKSTMNDQIRELSITTTLTHASNTVTVLQTE